MARLPVVLVHGYSDEGHSFQPWASVLRKNGYDVVDVNVVTYESLTNEVTVKDIAEAFDRALLKHMRLGRADQPFDVIVHSTGMLVVRSWLASSGRSGERLKRIKHLIGFAPATFGSPLAHKGRGWLGAMVKGNKNLGPDFLEAGDLILDALELGSRFTWDLAHIDLLGESPFYGHDAQTPYPFIFVGNESYEGLARQAFVNQPGTDGTVRWAGTSLDSRKITMNLTVPPENDPERKRIHLGEWSDRLSAPVTFVAGRNHGSIMSEPEETMQKLVLEALEVDSAEAYKGWRERAGEVSRNNEPRDKYQQFVVRMLDGRGDPIPDYNLALYTKRDGERIEFLDSFELDVHPYTRDSSYRCFHADIGQLETLNLQNLWMRLTLSTGTILVGYRGYGSNDPARPQAPPDETAEERTKRLMREDKLPTEIDIDMTPRLKTDQFNFFFPFTTTLVEISIDREPLPIDDIARLCRFIEA